jgi:hypothetical protein
MKLYKTFGAVHVKLRKISKIRKGKRLDRQEFKKRGPKQC